MLGLHEWGMCRGSKAWLMIGMAIRAAQAMGLQYEMDLDDEPMSRSLAVNSEAERMGMDSARKNSASERLSEDAFIQQEIRRRTFWSCYIMDRYLSSGKYRPQMLHAKELRIQLPASERSFLFAEQVRTLMLGEDDKNVSGAGRAENQNQRQQSVMLSTANCTPEPNVPSPKSMAMHESDEEKGRLEVGPDEGLVSRYVKVLEIYGQVIKWSCSGGRRYVALSFDMMLIADLCPGLKSSRLGTRAASSTNFGGSARNSKPVCRDRTLSRRKIHRLTSVSKPQHRTLWCIPCTFSVRSCYIASMCRSSRSAAPNQKVRLTHRYSRPTSTPSLLDSGRKAHAIVSDRRAR
jgi:hypothetical protein